MYGDFSRLRIGQAHEFASIWSQQGRVQLDSDLNDLMTIVLDHIRTLTVDVLGPFAAGYPGDAFQIHLCDDDPNDLLVQPGDYYVHGLRCRMEPPRPGGRKPRRYRSHAGHRAVPPLPDEPFVVELVVWEETRSAIQDPRLLEPALGPVPPDTTLRTVVRYALGTETILPHKRCKVTGDETHDVVAPLYEQHNQHDVEEAPRPQLRARARTPRDEDADASTVPDERGYRGTENQLYRVEIHTSGREGTATFKWSRDNGSVQYALRSVAPTGDGSQLTAELSERARDQYSDLDEGDWVELGDDDQSPLRPVEPLLQVVRYERGSGLVTLAGPDDFEPSVIDASQHPFLRRWDQHADVTADDNAIRVPSLDDPALSNGWFDLEDGVQVKFCDPEAVYRAGDYWLVPARSTTGQVLWPGSDDGRSDPVYASRPPLFRAPLALVLPGLGKVVDLRGSRWRTGVVYREHARVSATGEGIRLDVDEEVDEGAQEAPVTAPIATYEEQADEQGGVASSDRTSVFVMPSVTGSAAGAPPATERRDVVRLTVLDYQPQTGSKAIRAGTSFDRPRGVYSIGRARNSNILLEDPFVSRNHAALSVDDDSARIWDTGTVDDEGHRHAGSSNGTYLERGETRTQITESTALQHGDVVRLGAHRIHAVRLLVEFL